MSLLDDAPRPEAGRRPLRYQKVIDLVDQIIRGQDLQPGNLLPTQKELAELAGLSLITVRRALEELVRSGRVAGHQGVGTFVAQPRIVSEPARRGGLLATLSGRADPSPITTEILKVRDAEPDAAVARALGLAAGAVPFACFEHVYPAEAFALYISGRTSRRLLPAHDLAGWRASGSRRSG